MEPNKDIIQFKLSSGAEIVCEVLEWNDQEDPTSVLIVKNAMAIIYWDHSNGERSYVFRPWISFPDEKTDFVILNPDHICSMNRPGNYLSQQYHGTVEEVLENNRRRDETLKEEHIESLKKFHKILKGIAGIDNEEKETPKKSNVIQFPDPDKIH